MLEAGSTWSIQLSDAPEILWKGRSVHGLERSIDRYMFWAWAIHFYKYDGDLFLDGQHVPIRPGSVGIIPPGVRQEYRYRGRSEHLFAHFSVSKTEQGQVPIAVMQDLGADFARLSLRFEDAVRWAPGDDARMSARLWDILWELSDRTQRSRERPRGRHAAVEQTCQIIQSRLAEPLSLTGLARSAGVSPAHLTRLFRSELSETVTDYVRKCRLDRAWHLLLHSDLPIKQVACDVGIQDLQLFNKTIRRAFGVAPRALRERGPNFRVES
ncbi:MAG TPA: AraC family transcriptional regulator [Polyangiaceae bacterium]